MHAGICGDGRIRQRNQKNNRHCEERSNLKIKKSDCFVPRNDDQIKNILILRSPPNIFYPFHQNDPTIRYRHQESPIPGYH